MNLAKINDVIKASPAIQDAEQDDAPTTAGVERTTCQCLQRTPG